jgi:diguanylate cyclase (GGDEF)-like protein
MSANPIISMSGYAAARNFDSSGLIGSDPDRAELFDFLIALQTSLDVSVLLETFSLRLQAAYPHRGVRLETLWSSDSEATEEYVFGQPTGRCRRMLLHVGGHELGWIEVFSPTPPTVQEQRVIDRLLACLIHPLHSAIRFQRLNQQAMLDDLTGVGNRAALNRALAQEIARSERREDDIALSLMVFDLDGFKELNDRMGHLVGDEGLRQFARVLKKHLRDSDQLFRYGGDEFVVILPDADEKAGREIAQRLHERVVNECTDPVLGASIGLAQWERGMSAKELFRAADQAMYASKQQRRAAQTNSSSR